MGRRLLGATALLAVGTVLLVGTTAVHADDPPGDGVDGVDPWDDPTFDPLGTPEQRADAARQARRDRRSPLNATVEMQAGGPASSTAAADSRVLSMEQIAQRRNNWCGPAVARMIIGYLWRDRSSTDSADRGRPLSQRNLARQRYTTAGAEGGTDYWSGSTDSNGDMPKALNLWLGLSGSNTRFHRESIGTTRRLKSIVNFTTSPFYERPIATSIVEYAGGDHYNNHPPNREIRHWTALYGRKVNGSRMTVFIADPVGGSDEVSWSPGVKRKFQMRATRLRTLFQNDSRGFVW